MELTIRRLAPDDPELPAMMALMREAFAYMDRVIDPPSSIHRMTLNTLAQDCRTAEVWATGTPPRACIVIRCKADAFYLGKFCIAP